MSFTALVDAGTLARHLDDPAWRIFDVRHQLADTGYGEGAYSQGHMPGAFFLHCDRDLSGPTTGSNGRHPLPDPEVLAAKLAACGVDGATQVVVYDDCQGMIAGRLWWLLRWLGHDRVAVLDGGLQAWLALGGAMTAEVSVAQPARFEARPRDWVVDAHSILTHVESSAMRVVDARSPDRFRGENETIDPVGGHIPGAYNRFFKDNLGPDGRFKPAEALRAEWLAFLGDAAPEQVVHQCGSGVSACHNILAMEVAGLPSPRLYAGSWSEWCADPQRPVAR
ncbi:MAG TPA: sulfurtransferase [Rhodocyclaceae bacterium]|nr:sulfurtransferase [Rhodocyclaceae bacterium]